jgi:multidrug transporter EmrE-like cation transporter
MQFGTLILILGCVAMSAVAQLLLKLGMSVPATRGAVEAREWGALLLQIATNPWVLGGLSLYFLSAVLWLLVLAKVQLSFAYPFVGLGFIVTMLMGWWFMNDALGMQRIAGTLLITAGVVLVARGG